MREVKFRAWHTKTKKMYAVKGWMQGDYGVPGKFADLCVYCVDEYGVTERFADGLTELLQFTGLLDRHGKEIYEGDLIHRPDIGIAMLVRWNEENAGFDLTMKDPKNFNAVTLWYTQATHTDYEVIGNIYEHPELFQKAEKHNGI